MGPKILKPAIVSFHLYKLFALAGMQARTKPAMKNPPPAPQAENKTNPESKFGRLIYEKDEGFSPCPPGEICSHSYKLFESGKLLQTGKYNREFQLSAQQMEDVKNFIRASGILDKQYPWRSDVLDYQATYALKLDGKNGSYLFPNGNEILDELDRLIFSEDVLKQQNLK